MDKYAETKEILSNMAAVKMDMNSHKGSIEDVDPEILLKLMRDEIVEIEQAVINENNMILIIEEAADTMNYLVALVHQQIEKYRSRKHEH